MANKKKYKVHYTANDGTNCSFTFMSDKSFRRYTHNASGGILDLGAPIVHDMLAEATKLQNREDTNMYKHGGWNFLIVSRTRYIECLDTGEAHYYF